MHRFRRTHHSLVKNLLVGLLSTSSSGDITGRTINTTLTADGRVTQLTVAPNIRSRPILLKTLTPKQVAEFKALLQQQRLANFNRLAYLTPASVADVPTITLQAPGQRVSYTSIEQAKVPQALRMIIRRWAQVTAKV
jgi:hypothetical protein